MNSATPFFVVAVVETSAPAEATSVTDVPSATSRPDESFTVTFTVWAVAVAESVASTERTFVEAAEPPMVNGTVAVFVTEPTVTVTVAVHAVPAVGLVSTTMMFAALVVADVPAVDAVTVPCEAPQAAGANVAVGLTPGITVPAVSSGWMNNRTPVLVLRAYVVAFGVAESVYVVPVTNVCIFATTESNVPVITTVFVTEMPFVVNVIVAVPATPPPVRVTVACPFAASVPVHDWLVHVVTPVPALRTPRVVLTVRVPPEIGALLFESTNVAVMLAVVPVEVTVTAVAGETVADAGRPGATAVGVVNVTDPAPAICA